MTCAANGELTGMMTLLCPVPEAAAHQKGYKNNCKNVFKTVVLDALEGKMDSCILRHATCWNRIIPGQTQPSKPAAPRPASTCPLYIRVKGSPNKANTSRTQQKVLILCSSVSDIFGLRIVLLRKFKLDMPLPGRGKRQGRAAEQTGLGKIKLDRTRIAQIAKITTELFAVGNDSRETLTLAF